MNIDLMSYKTFQLIAMLCICLSTNTAQAEDTAPPTIKLLSGIGPFLKTNKAYQVVIETDIKASCKFASQANSTPDKRHFSQLPNRFSSEKGIIHNVSLKPKYNQEQWSLWVKCRSEKSGEITTSPFKITSVFVDKIPGIPTITILKGNESFEQNVHEYDVEIKTDIAATCKYASTANSNGASRTYEQLTKRFSATGNLHTTHIKGLYKPSIWQVWATCQGIESQLYNEVPVEITATFDLPPTAVNKPPKFNTTLYIADNIQRNIGQIDATDPEKDKLVFTLLDESEIFTLSLDGKLSLKEGKNLTFGSQYLLNIEISDTHEHHVADVITIDVSEFAINLPPQLTTTELNVSKYQKQLGQLESIDPEQHAVNFTIYKDKSEIFVLTPDGDLSLKEDSSLTDFDQTLFPLSVLLTDSQGASKLAELSVLATSTTSVPVIEISKNEDHILVLNGDDSTQISLSSFGLNINHNQQQVINDLTTSMLYRGFTLDKPEAPREVFIGNDWVEIRGWYWRAPIDIDNHLGVKPHENGLYYIVRYKFFAGKPYLQVNFTLSDRHNGHAIEGQWDKAWRQQIAQNFTINLTTNKSLPQNAVQHTTAHSGKAADEKSIISVNSDIDSKKWRYVDLSELEKQGASLSHLAEYGPNDVQLFNTKSYAGNKIEISPNYTGNVHLQLAQLPISKQIKDLAVIITHENGTDTLYVDQSLPKNDLGEFTLNNQSKITISAQHSGYQYAHYVFNRLHLIENNNVVKTIKAQHIDGKLFDADSLGLVVNNFWQKYPMSAASTQHSLVIQTLPEPVRIGAGASFSVDFAINYNTHKARTSALEKAISSAPSTKSFPKWWHRFDGVKSDKVTTDPYYSALLQQTWPTINKADTLDNNFGWKDYGDFKIAPSYTTTHEDGFKYRHENWGNQQVDLGLGLLISWLNTENEKLWGRALAANQQASNVLISKFEPLAQKRSGGGYRKGDCAQYNSHWCNEPLAAFGFHSRALLLNHHLTNNQWSLDVAQMVIDNAAYFAQTRTEWTAKHSDRTLGWVLRNLYYGEKVFPHGTANLNQHELGYLHMPHGSSYRTILNKLLTEYIYQFEQAGNKLIGNQPVWQARIIEGLIMALDGDLVDSHYTDRNDNLIKDKKEKLKLMITQAISYLDLYELERDDEGNFHMLYARESSKWTSLKDYGFFWLNAWQWVEQNTQTSLQHSSEDMYRWLSNQYIDQPSNIRQWTSVMGITNFVHNR